MPKAKKKTAKTKTTVKSPRKAAPKIAKKRTTAKKS